MQESNFIGIDFGAKLAGTTAACFEKNGHLRLLQSAKKQDADAWLRKIIAEQNPNAVFMDAPLTLPGVYNGQGSDFHYRACDRAVGGMSPMFLGGLTARAMKLRATFPTTPFFEIYPARLVTTLFQVDFSYKQDIQLCTEKILEKLPVGFENPPENWHQMDATLAWLSGWRHGRSEALKFGEDKEGVIWV